MFRGRRASLGQACRCPADAVFVRPRRRNAALRPYRRAMHSSFESSLPEDGDGPSFLSRLGIAFVLVTAGVGLAMWMAAAG